MTRKLENTPTFLGKSNSIFTSVRLKDNPQKEINSNEIDKDDIFHGYKVSQ